MPLKRAKRVIKAVFNFELEEFFKLESASSILLLGAAIIALVMSNIELLNTYYTWILNVPIQIHIADLVQLDKPIFLWINDGLMAIFFLIVGLELKREMIEGHLANLSRAMLPVIAAVGGMLVPALIYIGFNFHGENNALDGWAIPAATDIAFSLGILTLLGSRVPSSLKIFLLALAIIDDLGAIIIIAFFYSGHNLDTYYLLLAGFVMIGLVFLNMMRISNVVGYILLGILLWFFVLKSGIHATLAGVVLAAFIPLQVNKKADYASDSDNYQTSPLRRLEQTLHPWVAYLIMPVFAFANAGVPFSGMTADVLFGTVPLGIAAGLLFGKVLGVLLFVWLAVKSGVAQLPTSATWSTMAGIGFLCGIGFTMSLFIGSLAFTSIELIHQVRFGVLLGSCLSGVIGYFILRQAIK